ncbi:copper amine oxidase N-terminal domain-containing protein [Lysinibacillus sp. JNUCC 51]|uniref:copper amine oxidase N-terminal domain-containing protein n=1 Tax=Lysinibacillus sp. JNUCC-51 TaxID=2792479 RepID=UPI001936C707|nr:copper amine oxidase N-terminal domain-containing protein [Lysinibacillus sp. JNUCC-51]
MIRKITTRLTLALILLVISFAFAPSTEAASAIKVEIDGDVIQFDQGAVAINGRTLVPMRTIFEELESTVQWTAKTKTITANRGTKKITLVVGSKTATVNGQKITLDVPPQIINGRTLVPLRFISEALGAKVDWNNKTKTVSITTFEVSDRYYFVNLPTLNLDLISEDRYYQEDDIFNPSREIVSDIIFTSYLDNTQEFLSQHSVQVSNGGTGFPNAYDAYMYLDGTIANGKASGDYTIELYDINSDSLKKTYEGTFKDIKYDRNIKTTVQEIINKNHVK